MITIIIIRETGYITLSIIKLCSQWGARPGRTILVVAYISLLYYSKYNQAMLSMGLDLAEPY